MRTLVLSLLALLATTCALLSNGAPVSAEPTDKEKSEMAAKVYTLLKDKCASCHGADAKKVMGKKGTLNYILDYDKLMSEKLIDTASPEKSPLYEEISEGDMPRELDKDGKPKTKKRLAQAEIDLVLNWIKGGAPKWKSDGEKPNGAAVVPEVLRINSGSLATTKFDFELYNGVEFFRRLNGKLPVNLEYNPDKNVDHQLWFAINDGSSVGKIGQDGKVSQPMSWKNLKDEVESFARDSREDGRSDGIVVIVASGKAKPSSFLDLLSLCEISKLWRVRFVISNGIGERAWIPLAGVASTGVQWGEDRGPDELKPPKDGKPAPRISYRYALAPERTLPAENESEADRKAREAKMKDARKVEDKWAPMWVGFAEAKNSKDQKLEVFLVKQDLLTAETNLKLPEGYKVIDPNLREAVELKGIGGTGEEGLKAALSGVQQLSTKLTQRRCMIPLGRDQKVDTVLQFVAEAWVNDLFVSFTIGPNASVRFR